MDRGGEDKALGTAITRILGSRGSAQPTWTVCSMVEAAAAAVPS